jgi:hypothetical protein
MINTLSVSVVCLTYRYYPVIKITKSVDYAIRRAVSESPRTDDLQILPTQTDTQSGADMMACYLHFSMPLISGDYEK